MIDHPWYLELIDNPIRLNPLFYYLLDSRYNTLNTFRISISGSRQTSTPSTQSSIAKIQPKGKEKEEPIDVDSSNDESTFITNSIRLSIIKVNKPDIYNRERNSLKN